MLMLIFDERALAASVLTILSALLLVLAFVGRRGRLVLLALALACAVGALLAAAFWAASVP